MSLLKEGGGILIFNVKSQPFDYADKLGWRQRRNEFYSVDNTAHLTEDFIFNFYEGYFEDKGYKTKFAFLEKRPQEPGLYALTTQVTNELN